MSLGKDLASIRKNQNLSLEDIQNAIKIPLDTLKSIENGSIFTEPNRNNTYVRSFVRSYAKVLKIDDEDIVLALDEMEAGTYSGNLFGHERTEMETYTHESDAVDKEEASEESYPSGETVSIPSQDQHSSQQPASLPEAESINWADLGSKFTTASKKTRAWVGIAVVIVILLLTGGGYLFWDNITSIFGSDQEMTEEPTDTGNSGDNAIIPAPVDSSAMESNQTGPEPEQSVQPETVAPTQQQSPTTLGDTLTMAVYAAYGQLEPIRITSDLNWRTNPFWMEQGEAYNFDFKDTLLIRGQYSRILLMFNGHVIENPRQSYFNTAFNSIMVTRSILDQPKYLAAPPETFPLEVGPPDSTVYRIRF